MNIEFIRVRSTKDITISAILIITGLALAIIPSSTPVNILGYIALFTGIILFITMKTAYKDNESGVKYCKKERFFAQSMRQEILDTIATKPETLKLTEEDKGNGIRLDIYHSKVNGKVYIQLFEYIPYKYEPCSRLYEFELNKVQNIL